MAKLQFLQAVMVVWCVVIYSTSEAVKNPKAFKQFVQNRVIATFQPWAQNYGQNSNQFAAMLLMNTDTNWDTFNYNPTPTQQALNARAQPTRAQMVNYYAALPKDSKHSEQRIFNSFKCLLSAYKKHNQGAKPQTLLLYTWYLPCYTRISTKYSGCTNIVLNNFNRLQRNPATRGMNLVVAYTDANGNFQGCSCNKEQTTQQFKNAGIDLVHVPDSQMEAFIENIESFSELINLME